MHKGLAVMNSRLRGQAGTGQIAALDKQDAWSDLGTAQRFPEIRKVFVCADILAGMSVAVAGANLCVDGLGSVHHSGGGSFCVSALKRFALETASQRIFLSPKDAAAARFWKGQGFEPCNPRSVGMSVEDLKALEDVLFIPDPEDCDILMISITEQCSRQWPD